MLQVLVFSIVLFVFSHNQLLVSFSFNQQIFVNFEYFVLIEIFNDHKLYLIALKIYTGCFNYFWKNQDLKNNNKLFLNIRAQEQDWAYPLQNTVDVWSPHFSYNTILLVMWAGKMPSGQDIIIKGHL